TRLGCELAGLLQAIIEFARKLFFEKYHKFGRGRSILCPAKAENIHADLPCNFFRRATERGNRVRESGAVHVQKHFALPRESSDGADFIAIINRAELGCLGNADHARLVRMTVELASAHSVPFIDVYLAGVNSTYMQFLDVSGHM